jgi:hypothetical protein
MYPNLANHLEKRSFCAYFWLQLNGQLVWNISSYVSRTLGVFGVTLSSAGADGSQVSPYLHSPILLRKIFFLF